MDHRIGLWTVLRLRDSLLVDWASRLGFGLLVSTLSPLHPAQWAIHFGLCPVEGGPACLLLPCFLLSGPFVSFFITFLKQNRYDLTQESTLHHILALEGGIGNNV